MLVHTNMNTQDPAQLPAISTEAVSTVLWQAAPPLAQTSESLVAQAYETLWKQIVEGERQPGERLVDAELVTELGISRTPIRNALYQLQQAGLLAASPGRGFYVAILAVEDVSDLYDLRTILEVAAVRAATPRLAEEDLLAARDEIIRLQALSERTVGPQFLTSDVQFHQELLAGHSGNRRLAEAIAQQRARMSIFLARGTRLPGGIAAALAEHAVIVEALLERDGERAAATMEQHIQRVKEDALRALAAERQPRVRRIRSVAPD